MSLAFVRRIHRCPVNSPHKGPVTRKLFHLMTSSWRHLFHVHRKPSQCWLNYFFFGILLRAISSELLKISTLKMSLKLRLLKLLPRASPRGQWVKADNLKYKTTRHFYTYSYKRVCSSIFRRCYFFFKENIPPLHFANTNMFVCLIRINLHYTSVTQICLFRNLSCELYMW